MPEKEGWECSGEAEQKKRVHGVLRNMMRGRTAAEAESPILWPPDSKSQVIGKDPNVGKD